MSDLSGHVSRSSHEPAPFLALTSASIQPAFSERTNHALEALNCQLLFTANDLVGSRTRTSSDKSDRPVLYCEECHMCALGDSPIAHVESCRVGRLASILTRMCDAQSQTVPTYAPNRRKEDALAAEACAEDRNSSRGDFNEPWGFQRTAPTVFELSDVDGAKLAIMLGSPDKAEETARRIYACVNFCAGIDTETLRSELPLASGDRRRFHEITHLRRALPWLPTTEPVLAVQA
jgi:hypothetical protein